MKESIKKRIEAVRRGEVPEGFTRTDSGVMPEEWPNSTIGKIIVFHSEKSTINNQYPVLTSARSGLALQTEYFEDQVTREENAGYNVIPRGYVTYRSRSDDGRFIFNQNQIVEKGIVSCFYPVFRIIEDLADPTFVLSYLNNYLGRQIMKEIVGTSQLVLSEKKLSALRLPCPPLAEQQKIADILSTCDRVIELKQQLLEEKRRQKRWLMQKLMNPNGGLRLPGFKEAWTSTQFGEIVTRSKNMISAPKCKKGTRCIELEHIEGGSGRLLGYCNAETQESNKCQFSTGDILFGKLRPYLQKALKAPFDGVCSSEIWVLRPCLDVVCNDYLFYIVQSERFMLIANTSSGTKMPRAEWSLVQNFVVELPTIAEQKAIANMLAAADQEITLLNAELEVWQQKKKALMQLLLTGLVRVNA